MFNLAWAWVSSKVSRHLWSNLKTLQSGFDLFGDFRYETNFLVLATREVKFDLSTATTLWNAILTTVYNESSTWQRCSSYSKRNARLSKISYENETRVSLTMLSKFLNSKLPYTSEINFFPVSLHSSSSMYLDSFLPSLKRSKISFSVSSWQKNSSGLVRLTSFTNFWKMDDATGFDLRDLYIYKRKNKII